MENTLRRPLYAEFAWAYDLIIAGPVSSRCDFLEDAASQRGLVPGSRILDAGCGTGSYSIELAQRGYSVYGLDVSTELVSIARKKAEKSSVPLTFQVGDILKLSRTPKYDGILCRGVLNDMIDDRNRIDLFFSFAHALRKDGVLILDVREWNSSALRKEREPVFEKLVETKGGTLTFRAVTQLDYQKRQLLIAESFIVEQNDSEVVTKYNFVMRCWTAEELHSNLTNAGFGSIACFGDYAYGKPVGSTDRIVAVASLKY